MDRERLHGIEGRSRKGLIELAHQFGFQEIPTPSTGCALTEQLFAPKVRDLIELAPDARQWDYELLRVGRHFRFDSKTKVVLGRDESQNEQLRLMAAQDRASHCWIVEPENFRGPTALVTGPFSEAALEFTGGLMLRYSKADPETARIVCRLDGRSEICAASGTEFAAHVETI